MVGSVVDHRRSADCGSMQRYWFVHVSSRWLLALSVAGDSAEARQVSERGRAYSFRDIMPIDDGTRA